MVALALALIVVPFFVAGYYENKSSITLKILLMCSVASGLLWLAYLILKILVERYS